MFNGVPTKGEHLKYYRGNFYKDQHIDEGWLIGRFRPGFRKTKKVEIKFKEFRKGRDTGHRRKYQKSAVECTFILKGRISGEIDGRKVILRKGDYVVIPPGVPSNFPTKILRKAEVLTVKVPSRKGDTKR